MGQRFWNFNCSGVIFVSMKTATGRQDAIRFWALGALAVLLSSSLNSRKSVLLNTPNRRLRNLPIHFCGTGEGNCKPPRGTRGKGGITNGSTSDRPAAADCFYSCPAASKSSSSGSKACGSGNRFSQWAIWTIDSVRAVSRQQRHSTRG